MLDPFAKSAIPISYSSFSNARSNTSMNISDGGFFFVSTALIFLIEEG